jgi:mevalonate kinase
LKSISSSPAKAILFGEHFVVYGVKAILAAVDKRVTVTTTKTNDENVTIKSTIARSSIPVSTHYEKTRDVFRPFFYIAKKIIQKHSFKGGLDITIESNVPSGVGLGSSSACCVAAASSIIGLFENSFPDEILKMAIDAERTIFKETSGADCTVCTFGGLIEYDKKNGYKRLDVKPKFHLVIANSKISHSTDKVVAKVRKFKEKSDAFSNLCAQESELIERAIKSLREDDLVSLGKLMSQNQNYLEQIGVSNEKLDSMIRLANSTSFGSKLTGAGDGGCIIALADESNLGKTIDIFSNKNYECFSVKIDTNGLQHKIES